MPGYPATSVPAGFVRLLPVGIVLLAASWSQPTLITISCDIGQPAEAWQPPRMPDTLDGKPVTLPTAG